MRFRLAHSVLLTAFVSDLDTTVPILSVGVPVYAIARLLGGFIAG